MASNLPIRVGDVHEVALATQLAAVVKRAAQGRPVARINVEIGALRQVVPASLHYAWRFVSRETSLEDSELALEFLPCIIRCDCGFEGGMSGEYSVLCPECGRPGTVIQGEEFRVIDIEVLRSR
ncbi:hydrogenase maturation nickel metallochaperone HypA [Corynebacterium pelargi]|uniref:Hydrogenase maturation factor HypA n=1 Tax=Corynebacterium pelargi TaxID=1471400 RepID=A0A410WBS7_9CORY|nr:hydrogenase maturation nickel metallochaperone HypA [Corynebacterium pelargi]QAU53418.1 hydrogenase nickel incorporation protein [Corynebacterium pelargi]